MPENRGGFLWLMSEVGAAGGVIVAFSKADSSCGGER